MLFLKENLLYRHYTWLEEINKDLYTGAPSRRRFNRFDGEQVLYIINLYGSMSDGFTVEEGRRIEDMIQKELPIEPKSELSVFNWLMASAKLEK